MIRKTCGRGLMCAAMLVAAAGVTTGARGQLSTWDNPVSGLWNNAFNWNLGMGPVPNSASAAADISVAGTYTVTMTGSVTVASVVLGNSGVTLIRDNTSWFDVSSVANDGVIWVGTGSVNQSLLRARAVNVPITGTGMIRLGALANRDSSVLHWVDDDAEGFAQGGGHTIAGSGAVYCRLTNDGVVTADVFGHTLALLSTSKTNTGVFRADNGGTLAIDGIGITNSGTIEVLDGSLITMNVASISGGVLQSAGTGLVRAAIGTALVDVSNSAPIVVVEGGGLRLGGTVVNNNVITINEGGGEGMTILRASAGGSMLTGTGTVVLNAGNDLWSALMQWGGNVSETMTQTANHTIRGTGRITVGLVNDGLVDADRSGRTLQLWQAPKVNNGTFRASNGGTLDLLEIPVTNTGTIEALDGSVVTLRTATIDGGVITSAGTGLVRVMGETYLASVTSDAPIGIANQGSLRIIGTLVNDDVITVNDDLGGSSTHLQSTPGDSLLMGTGTVVLNAGPVVTAASLYWTVGPAEVLSQFGGHTIRGTGQILVNLVNDGLVEADQTGLELQLSEQDKTNNSVMRATNGATLAVTGIGITNTGEIEAVGDSLVRLHDGSISGGMLEASGAGVFRVSGTSQLESLTNNAPMVLVDSGVLQGVGTIINNNVITINETAGPSATQFQTASGNTVLTGTGSLRLNASSGPGSALVIWSADNSETLTQGSDHSISGTGTILSRFFNNGTISPGANPGDTGVIDFGLQTCTFGSTSTYRCDINGILPEECDRLTGVGLRELNGRLVVSFGFQPVTTGTYEILSGPYSGQFETFEIQRGFYIEYLENSVRVGYSGCFGDWDQDGDVDSDDITKFFGGFENGEADYDQDGDTDSDDIIGFFGSFENGC